MAVPSARFESVAEAAAEAEAVALAVPFAAAAETATALGDLAGRALIDCTNPVGPGLKHGLDNRRAGAEAVQEANPSARISTSC